MKLNTKQKRILDIILNSKDDLTAAEIFDKDEESLVLAEVAATLGSLKNKGLLAKSGKKWHAITENIVQFFKEDEQSSPEIKAEHHAVLVAIGELEQKLNIKPHSVNEKDLKLTVLERLSPLLDPSISKVLDAIRADLTDIDKAA